MIATFEIDAFVVAPDGMRRTFHLRISEPTKTEGEDEYSCLVHAPALFERDKAIFGVDPEQALQLAVQFVKSLLGGARIIDRDGSEIQLSILSPGSGE